jgi:hypothetical protein
MLWLLFCGSRFYFGEAFLDDIQLLPQIFGLVLEHLCLHFRIWFLVCHLILIRRSTPSESHPSWQAGSEEHIPPSPAAATKSMIPGTAPSKETHSHATPGSGILAPLRTNSSAVSSAMSGHFSHSHGSCSISSRHFRMSLY